MIDTKHKRNLSRLATALLFLVINHVFAGGVAGKIINTNEAPVQSSIIKIEGTKFKTKTNEKGEFEIDGLKAGKYLLIVEHDIYAAHYQPFTLATDDSFEKGLNIYLFEKETNLDVVHIEEEMPIGTGPEVKKDMSLIDKTHIELKPNTEKQASDKIDRGMIAPITVMEYDGAGLQIGIGGRGLNPKRTAHYNTRQNGHDISADALGYPETYYTPPAEAIQSISIVRGAASLQFGPQFGGMINFNLKEGPSTGKKNEFISANKYGSFNQFHSFTSFASERKKLKTYSFYHLKTGNGWRDNSKYTSHTGYIGLDYFPTDGLDIKLQFTHHQYVAQQPGGLTDAQFEKDPTVSYRERNWFNINWNVAALILNYNFDKDFWINSKTFGVFASRNSVGFIQSPTLIDPGAERTLITGDFQNVGNETKIIRRYNFYKKKLGVFTAGVRLYKGWAQTGQGVADNSADPIFKYNNPDSPENSQYTFPSRNLSLFAEHSFLLNKRWSVTPGARYEYISTETDGYFNRYLIGLNGDTLDVANSTNTSLKNRNILLTGLGVSYKFGHGAKLTTNFSQNFRSVNFSDVNIVIPNFRVDDNIQDETGHNLDLTFNKTWDKVAFLGATAYYLHYNNRIGVIWQVDPSTYDTYQYRTNVSASRTLGFELTGSVDLAKITALNDSTQKLNLSTAVTITDAEYIEETSIVYGNKVEMVPLATVKTGITYEYKNFLLSGMFNFQTKQYSEATNAETSANGLYGVIPNFYVIDAKVGYTFKKFVFQVSANNLTNHMYFTQRANSYPGPGIIPSEGRTFFGSVIVKL